VARFVTSYSESECPFFRYIIFRGCRHGENEALVVVFDAVFVLDLLFHILHQLVISTSKVRIKKFWGFHTIYMPL